MSWAGLKIGDGVLIAGGCSISAGKFDIDDLSVKFIDQTGYSEGPVTIGHNVWIATGSTILDSVQIGDDAVISAGSVVSKNVPNCTVVHGNPAAAIFTRR
jgi:acetyltransferase-like isoleucine patch superfamily enzyme